MANELINECVYTEGYLKDNSGTYQGYLGVGHDNTYGDYSTTMRFTNVQISQASSIDTAQISIYIGTLIQTDPIYVRIWGIDEDNTGSGALFGRSKTSASNTHYTTGQSAGDYFTIGVGSIVQEIVSRGAWSPGNAMGFIIENNGTTGDNYIVDNLSTVPNSYFSYRANAQPNFKPTPLTITAPSLPVQDSFGIKISKPNQSVLTSTEQQEYFTTRKKQLKVVDENKVIADATPNNIVISHGLGYIPFVQVYQKDGTRWIRLPKANYFSADYAMYIIDSSHLTIMPPYANAEFYYYIFLEKIL